MLGPCGLQGIFSTTFAGDGATCNPTPAVDALAGMYVTDGPSKIACTEGSNIAQPPGSPGWVDDPTGSVQGSAAHAVSPDQPIRSLTQA